MAVKRCTPSLYADVVGAVYDRAYFGSFREQRAVIDRAYSFALPSMARTMSSLPPSGPWSGYYLYGYAGPKHRMNLGLVFSREGKISGEGIDDIAPFTINGTFDAATNQANWTKSYVGMHSVEYRGFYDQRSICGTWILAVSTGAFWIWPSGMRQTEGVETEVEEPVVLAQLS